MVLRHCFTLEDRFSHPAPIVQARVCNHYARRSFFSSNSSTTQSEQSDPPPLFYEQSGILYFEFKLVTITYNLNLLRSEARQKGLET